MSGYCLNTAEDRQQRCGGHPSAAQPLFVDVPINVSRADSRLDGNGGPGAYPYNIKDSKYTHICKTIE